MRLKWFDCAASPGSKLTYFNKSEISPVFDVLHYVMTENLNGTRLYKQMISTCPRDFNNTYFVIVVVVVIINITIVVFFLNDGQLRNRVCVLSL